MKEHYCFLEKFNNYFNRKIIMFNSLEDYENASKDFFIPVDAEGGMLPFDFNPNDNVMTEIIANGVPFTPDYLLILDSEGNINSRWFVMEEVRNRKGQWTYTLKRDVIADHIDSLYDAPIFVEKGMLQEDDPFIVNSEGMSFNQIKKDETRLLDKSKSSWIVGYMAKNIGGSDVNVQVANESIKIDYVTLGQIASDIGTTEGVLDSLLNFGDETTNKAYFSSSFSMKVAVAYTGEGVSSYTDYQYNFNEDFTNGTGAITASGTARPYLFGSTLGTNQNLFTDLFKQAVINNKSLLLSQLQNILGTSYLLTNSQLEQLKTYNGKYVKYNGEFYKLNIDEIGSHNTSKINIKNDGTYSSITNIANDTVSLASGIMPLHTGTYNPLFTNAYILQYIVSNEKTVVISLKFLSSSDFIPQLDAQISSGRNTTGDQEYDIFAIPLNVKIYNSGNHFETIEDYSRRIASAIGIQQNAKIYDLQLLPYCPVPEFISGDNSLDITDLTEHENFDYIYKNISDIEEAIISSAECTITLISGDDYSVTVTKTLPNVTAGEDAIISEVLFLPLPPESTMDNLSYSVSGDVLTLSCEYHGTSPVNFLIGVRYLYPKDNTPCGIIFYASSSSFSAIIDEEISVDKSKKIISNCYTWRLISPNYQGAFEFNIAKNGGTVKSFNVFCTYKPFTPVIKVAPNFEWLYGMEFQDNRGLICAGDFSLPRATDAWETYQLQNKNYQNIFNRDIQHLDFMQSIEMRNQLISGAVGILGDTAKGAGAGAFTSGSPMGAVVGGVLGGATSAVGYAIDVDTLARTQREYKQLAIDKFNYQLGNIKALPYTLTKVGSFDIISKIFPVVEEYSCSEKEFEAFDNKIKYESMTVMRIGTLREFANFNGELHYFKGMLIRNDEIADDPHTLNAIYEELLKGVYI